jgi:hypothetical protein
MEEQDKRDRLIAEWILRAATLEKLLLSKGLITDKELVKAYKESVSQMTEFIKIIAAQKGNTEQN